VRIRSRAETAAFCRRRASMSARRRRTAALLVFLTGHLDFPRQGL
jgi:hypothetical protein